MQELLGLGSCSYIREGAKIETAVLGHIGCDDELRMALLGDFKVGIHGPFLESNIKRRLILLNQIDFQQKCFLITIGDDGLEVVDF